MNKTLRVTLLTLLLSLLLVICFTACDDKAAIDGLLDIGTPPETTEQVIPEGTFYVRCSEPEANLFSIQFVGAVPTSYVDYVGFEANKLYADGTKGPVDTAKVYTLHRTITDSENDIVLSSADFGIENGYLFTRALQNIPTDEEGLCYEIAAYYVIDNEIFYTAKQTFSIDEIIEEHILANIKLFDYKEVSPLIDVQQWVKHTTEIQSDEKSDLVDRLSNTYYLGASAPDDNGNFKMYICFALPTLKNNTVGIRYNFTETEGEDAGIKTQVRRARTNTLYGAVISETDTLTAEDFGMEEAYLAVIGFSDDLNTVLCRTYEFNLLAYCSQTIHETTVVDASHAFKNVIDACIRIYASCNLATYTFIPSHYSDWVSFSEANENAVGDGKFRIRASEADNNDGAFKFTMQIACAVPTRFAERIAFVYTIYDKEGNSIGAEKREISVSTLYPTVFDNGDAVMTASDFGFERGYIMTMLLNNIEVDGEVDAILIEAYYRVDVEKNYVASLLITLEDLTELVTIVW